MIETLADIEALSLSCRLDQSKEYIAEAIRCYKAGAFRAAIVSTWIAVVFDLIDKIRELSLSGDAAAKELEKKYETYIDQIEQNNQDGFKCALAFEREILETCRDKLEFFDPQQFIDLTRLREDRHRCPHPSFQKVGVPYYPCAEQARVHIRNAVVHVLAQPPVQGKAALAQLKILVGSAYFPTDTQKAAAQLENSELKNATEALVRAFIDQLVFDFLKKSDPLFLKNQVIAAINATHTRYPALVEERLKKQLNKVVNKVLDPDFHGYVALVASVNGASSLLEQASIDKIVEFIEKGPGSDVLGLLESLPPIERFLPAVRQRVESLDLDQLAEAINTHGMRELAKERALDLLSRVRNFDRANSVFSKVVLPLFSCLSTDDVARIIRMPEDTGADLLGAHAYKLFIDKVRKTKLLKKVALNRLLKANGASYLIPQSKTA